MNENKPDVLSVMRSATGELVRLNRTGPAQASEMDEAVAVVAELIEAAEKVAHHKALDDLTFMVNRPGLSLAVLKLQVILDRAGGAANK